MPDGEKHVRDEHQHLDGDEDDEPVAGSISNNAEGEGGDYAKGVACCREDVGLDHAMTGPLEIKVEI